MQSLALQIALKANTFSQTLTALSPRSRMGARLHLSEFRNAVD